MDIFALLTTAVLVLVPRTYVARAMVVHHTKLAMMSTE